MQFTRKLTKEDYLYWVKNIFNAIVRRGGTEFGYISYFKMYENPELIAIKTAFKNDIKNLKHFIKCAQDAKN